METSTEWSVQFKTAPDRATALVGQIRANHPYEVPEILVTRVDSGNPATRSGCTSTTRTLRYAHSGPGVAARRQDGPVENTGYPCPALRCARRAEPRLRRLRAGAVPARRRGGPARPGDRLARPGGGAGPAGVPGARHPTARGAAPAGGAGGPVRGEIPAPTPVGAVARPVPPAVRPVAPVPVPVAPAARPVVPSASPGDAGAPRRRRPVRRVRAAARVRPHRQRGCAGPPGDLDPDGPGRCCSSSVACCSAPRRWSSRRSPGRRWGSAGRALILAAFTALALAVPLVAMRRGLRGTAETFAAVGLLLVVLDGYAAWSVDLLGVAGWPGTRYAALVGGASAAVATGYAPAEPAHRAVVRGAARRRNRCCRCSAARVPARCQPVGRWSSSGRGPDRPRGGGGAAPRVARPGRSGARCRPGDHRSDRPGAGRTAQTRPVPAGPNPAAPVPAAAVPLRVGSGRCGSGGGVVVPAGGSGTPPPGGRGAGGRRAAGRRSGRRRRRARRPGARLARLRCRARRSRRAARWCRWPWAGPRAAPARRPAAAAGRSDPAGAARVAGGGCSASSPPGLLVPLLALPLLPAGGRAAGRFPADSPPVWSRPAWPVPSGCCRRGAHRPPGRRAAGRGRVGPGRRAATASPRGASRWAGRCPPWQGPTPGLISPGAGNSRSSPCCRRGAACCCCRGRPVR